MGLKRNKILLILLSVFLALSMITTTIFGVKFIKEKQKNNDITDLVAYYYSMDELTNLTYDIGLYLDELLYDYIYNSKYSNYDEVLEKLSKDKANTLSLIDTFYDQTKNYYKNIKSDNHYYINNNEIKDSVENIYNNMKEYYNFILYNNNLNYIELTTLNEPTYEKCNSSLKLFSARIMNLD